MISLFEDMSEIACLITWIVDALKAIKTNRFNNILTKG